MQGLFYWATRCATTPSAANHTATTSRTPPRVHISSAPSGSRWSTISRLAVPGDGERLNYGFLHVIDLPYGDLVEAAQQAHRRVYALQRRQDKAVRCEANLSGKANQGRD